MNQETLVILVWIFGLILAIQLILAVVYFVSKFYTKKRKLIIYGDAIMSFNEEAAIYIIDNVKFYEHFWKADLDNVRLYALGKEIEVIPFNSDDIPNGIRLLLSGITNSIIDTISVIGAVKYDEWEISFDAGFTKTKLHQIQSKRQLSAGHEMADVGTDTFEHHMHEFLNQLEAVEKEKYAERGKEAKRNGLLAHVNEAKSTATTIRYQILIPHDHPIFKMYNELNIESAFRFYHVYDGKLYGLDSKFLRNIGHLYEFEIFNLKPGSIYTGFTISFEDLEIVLPSSALYGITRFEDGELPTIDSAHLAKPTEGHTHSHEIWTEEIAITYLGEKQAKRMYDIIVKKHYEDSNVDAFIALTATEELYDEYEWLKGGDHSLEKLEKTLSHIHEVVRHGKKVSRAEEDVE